jgi:hypothetical protein
VGHAARGSHHHRWLQGGDVAVLESAVGINVSVWIQQYVVPSIFLFSGISASYLPHLLAPCGMVRARTHHEARGQVVVMGRLSGLSQ